MIKQIGVLALAVMFYSNSAHAFISKPTNSEVSTFLSVGSVVVVVAGPFYLSWKGFEGSSEATAARRTAATMRDAGPVPDMRIKSIEPADGSRRIVLENPDDTQQVAVLDWPQRENDPVNALEVGQLLSFQPTPARSGWIMRSPDGNSVGFLPTMGSAADAHSAPI